MEKLKITHVMACDEAATIYNILQTKDQAFIYRHDRLRKRMIFTSAQDCDTVKHLIPEFVLQRDSRQQRYAELIINYE